MQHILFCFKYKKKKTKKKTTRPSFCTIHTYILLIEQIIKSMAKRKADHTHSHSQTSCKEIPFPSRFFLFFPLYDFFAVVVFWYLQIWNVVKTCFLDGQDKKEVFFYGCSLCCYFLCCCWLSQNKTKQKIFETYFYTMTKMMTKHNRNIRKGMNWDANECIQANQNSCLFRLFFLFFLIYTYTHFTITTTTTTTKTTKTTTTTTTKLREIIFTNPIAQIKTRRANECQSESFIFVFRLFSVLCSNVKIGSVRLFFT